MTELEIWKPIEGYEGLYEVSTLGRVRSLGRVAKNGTYFPPIILKLKPNQRGYVQIRLHNDGEFKRMLVHRLVAEAFIPNPDNLPVVNHKDRNPSNNNVSNLEWCTQSHNVRWDGAVERRADTQRNRSDISKPINQYTLNGDFIKTWPSLKEINRELGADCSGISACCIKKPNHLSYYGFQWRFASECDGVSPIEPYNEPLKKKVLQYTLDGEFVREWPSLKSISKELGFAAGNICKHIQGQFKQAYKFIWRYAD